MAPKVDEIEQKLVEILEHVDHGNKIDLELPRKGSSELINERKIYEQVRQQPWNKHNMPNKDKYKGLTLGDVINGVTKKKTSLKRKLFFVGICLALIPLGIGVGFILTKLGFWTAQIDCDFPK